MLFVAVQAVRLYSKGRDRSSARAWTAPHRPRRLERTEGGARLHSQGVSV